MYIYFKLLHILRFKIISFILLGVCSSLYAQKGHPFLAQQNKFGGSVGEYGHFISKTRDGGFMMCSSTYSFDGDLDSSAIGHHAWIVKLNSEKYIEWSKNLGLYASHDLFHFSETQSGDFIFTGYASINNNKSAIWIVLLDQYGNKKWEKLIEKGDNCMGTEIYQLRNGTYTAMCTYWDTTGPAPRQDYRALIVNLDSMGNFNWAKSFGNGHNLNFDGIEQLPSGNVLLGGYADNLWGACEMDEFGNIVKTTYTDMLLPYNFTVSNDNCLLGYGFVDIDTSYRLSVLYKLDSSGKILHKKFIKNDSFSVSYVIATADSGLIACGESKFKDNISWFNHGYIDACLLKLDKNLKFEWVKTYGGRGGDKFQQVIEVNNKEYAAFGYITDAGGDITFDSANYMDIVVVTIKVGTENTIRGSIFYDDTSYCNISYNTQFLSNISIIDTFSKILCVSDENGNYTIKVDSGKHFITPVDKVLGGKKLLQLNCPSKGYPFYFKGFYNDTNQINFNVDYPHHKLLKVQFDWNRLRWCSTNSAILYYQNLGITPVNNVKISMRLTPDITIVYSKLPYIKEGNVYHFNIGTLEAGKKGYIDMKLNMNCIKEQIGKTLCFDAKISPSNLKEGYYALDSIWDKSKVLVEGSCRNNNEVVFMIKNIGEPMIDSAEFRIYSNAQFVYKSKYKLLNDSTKMIYIPANGKTYRLEVDQSSNFPALYNTSASVEACGSYSKSDLGFVDDAPANFHNEEEVENCLVVRTGFDPNDKVNSPQGIGELHVTKPNTPIQYTIHFQNTGNDTAYSVSIIDTVNLNLNISSFNFIRSSHPCKTTANIKTNIIQFDFSNINLPDSTTNPIGSNGYIIFTLSPNDNALNQRIVNKASIYFDNNLPIVTNEVINTYAYPIIVNEKFYFSEHSNFPNQKENIIVTYESYNIRLIFEKFSAVKTIYIYSSEGRTIKTINREDEESILIPYSHFSNGVFMLRAINEKGFELGNNKFKISE